MLPHSWSFRRDSLVEPHGIDPVGSQNLDHCYPFHAAPIFLNIVVGYDWQRIGKRRLEVLRRLELSSLDVEINDKMIGFGTMRKDSIDNQTREVIYEATGTSPMNLLNAVTGQTGWVCFWLA